MIIIGLILGLLIYFGLKVYHFEGGIIEFFKIKRNQIAAFLSVATTTAMALVVDWSMIEKVVVIANVPVYYAYAIAVIIGLGNSTLFFSILKKKK